MLKNAVENSLNCGDISVAKLLALLSLEASYIILNFME